MVLVSTTSATVSLNEADPISDAMGLLCGDASVQSSAGGGEQLRSLPVIFVSAGGCRTRLDRIGHGHVCRWAPTDLAIKQASNLVGCRTRLSHVSLPRSGEWPPGIAVADQGHSAVPHVDVSGAAPGGINVRDGVRGQKDGSPVRPSIGVSVHSTQ